MKSINDEILNAFPTTNDAARYIANEGKTTSLNACCNSIADVCKGRQQTAYGYKWEYATPEKEDTHNV